MKFTKNKLQSNLTNKNLLHQLRWANTSIEVDLKKQSESVEN